MKKNINAKNTKMNSIDNSGSVKKLSDKARFLRYLLVLIIAGVAGMILACIIFFTSNGKDRFATATIEFNYDGAAKNLTPTGEKFSISALTEDKVIEAALRELGLYDRYNAADIRNSCVVNPYYPENLLEQIREYDSLFDFNTSREVLMNEYYPTIYSLNVYDDFDPSISEQTLSEICYGMAEEFKKEFIQKNVYEYDTTSVEKMLIVEKYDYLQQAKIISNKVEMLRKYAEYLSKKKSDFRYNGLSFKDICMKCDDLDSNGVGKVKALISLNALSKSPALLKQQYRYDILFQKAKLKNSKASFEQLDRLIDGYQLDDIIYLDGDEGFTKLESNSSDTYDELLDRRQKLSGRLSEISANIESLELSLEDMKNADASSPMNAEVEKKLTGVCGQLAVLEDTFREMIASYNDSLVSDADIEIYDNQLYSPKVLSGDFMKQAVKCAGPFCVLALIGCLLHCIVCEIKKYKSGTVLF